MKRYKFLLVALLCFLCGCGWMPPWEYYNAESFIAYYLAGDIQVGFQRNNYIRNNYINLYWATFDTNEYSYKSRGKEKEIYEELCVKHNDTGYNKREADPKELETGDFTYRMVYWKDFVAIDVISDRDFDTEHPAGSSLGDVVMYWGFSYWEYVKSGYTFIYEGEYFPLPHSNPIEGYISNIPEEGLCLIKELSLHFPFVPESAEGEHNLTITITADDGTVYNLDCSVMLTTIQE